jgi:anti-sigma regulatory factor (Ser/Thr protein kinase)
MSDNGTPVQWFSMQPATVDGVRECLDSFDQHARETGMSENTRRKLALVLDEVLVNVATHAYGDIREGEMSVGLEHVGASGYRLLFRDTGLPFNPLYQVAPPTDVPLSSRRVGGLGIFLVRRLSAKLNYERIEGENRLWVELRSL